MCVQNVCGNGPTLTRKMSVQSLRMRSTQGSSSNMMECEISLKKPRTNFPMTKTTDTYRPMILEGEGRKKDIYIQEIIALKWRWLYFIVRLHIFFSIYNTSKHKHSTQWKIPKRFYQTLVYICDCGFSYPYPARKPRLGGLTLSLNMTMGRTPHGEGAQSAMAMSHHSWFPLSDLSLFRDSVMFR